MNESINENDLENFNQAHLYLAYIFCGLNTCIVIGTFVLFKSNSKNIIILKLKLLVFIFIDSILSLAFKVLKIFKNIITEELLFSVLASIEFYIFLSFMYQIFSTTELSKLSKEIELIKGGQISLIFLSVTFSYHKLSIYYLKLINFVQNCAILVCLIILYKYLINIIGKISINLLPKDIQHRKVYYYLQRLILIGFTMLLIFFFIKLLIIFLNNEIYILYIEITSNTIIHGLKYFVFILFSIIIYTLNYKNINNTDENIQIIQKNNIN